MTAKNPKTKKNKKLNSKKKQQGAVGFESFYRNLFGERWPSLCAAMSADIPYFSFQLPECRPYHMDSASTWAAKALGVQPGDNVLDMCAAPGGKTLLLAESLEGRGNLQSNDRSASRRQRLQKVISESLPTNLSENIQISGHDATTWGIHQKDIWDKILLDAPCSSERHVLHSPKHLQDWSESRAKQLAQRQYAMLVAALTALKPGGRMVYSTCSLNPTENDDVIAKLMKKKQGWASVLKSELSDLPGEKTCYGYHLLPDHCQGAGPIYFCILQKNERALID